VNPYGATKLAFEFALAAEASATGLRSLALRYFNAAGASDEGDLGERQRPRDAPHPEPHRGREEAPAVPRPGARPPDARRELPPRLHPRGDLARAHVLALEKLDATHDRALNLGSGSGQTVLEVVAAAERVLAGRSSSRTGPGGRGPLRARRGPLAGREGAGLQGGADARGLDPLGGAVPVARVIGPTDWRLKVLAELADESVG